MDEFKPLGGPLPVPTHLQRDRYTSRPSPHDPIKPTLTLSTPPIPPVIATSVADPLSPPDLKERQRLDELQSNIRIQAELKEYIFNYLVNFRRGGQEEGGELDIRESHVGENTIAENMLDVVGMLDDLLSRAYPGVMEARARVTRPSALAGGIGSLRTPENVKIRNPPPAKERPTSAKKVRFRLPAWDTMMDEETPPGSPIKRTLFPEDGESVAGLDPNDLVSNGERVKANVDPPEPPITSTVAVKAMFEKLLGPNDTAETAMALGAEGKHELAKATEKRDYKVQPNETPMKNHGDSVPPVSPRIVSGRQQKRNENAAREPQAAAGESKPAQKPEPRRKPAYRGREVTVCEFSQAKSPLTTLEEPIDCGFDDYNCFLPVGVKTMPEKQLSPGPTLCCLASSSKISYITSEQAHGDGAASAVSSASTKLKKINPVTEVIYKAETKMTTGERERYKPTSKLIALNDACKGVLFTETETLQRIPRKAEQAVRDTDDPGPMMDPAASGNSKDATPGDKEIISERVKPHSVVRRGDPWIAPKDDICDEDKDVASEYSHPTGFNNSERECREMDSLYHEKDRVPTGPQPIRRAEEIRRNATRTRAPSSAFESYIAGEDARPGEGTKISLGSTVILTARKSREVPKISLASPVSCTPRGPKELRMLGLTMEEIFLDPSSGDFIEPDSSVGGIAQLRRKYETEGREAWIKGELSLEGLQEIFKERENLGEPISSESGTRMSPPKSKHPKWGKKSRPTGMRRIFASRFGMKSSDSVMTRRPTDKSGSTRASGESVLPKANTTSIRGSIVPLFARRSSSTVILHENDDNQTGKPDPTKGRRLKLPSPQPHVDRHAIARYENTTKTPIARTEVQEKNPNPFDFPIPTNADRDGRPRGDPTSTPEVQRSPPVTVAGNLSGFSPHAWPTPSRLPTRAYEVVLKQPQSGAGSRPTSRVNSRAGSRSNTRLSQGATPGSSPMDGDRRRSVSRSFTMTKPASRVASRAGETSKTVATASVGEIDRHKGVSDLRMLQDRKHQQQASAAPKMGVLLGNECPESRAGRRSEGHGDERAGSSTGNASRISQTPRMAPLVPPGAAHVTGSGYSGHQPRSDRTRGSCHDTHGESQPSAYAENSHAEQVTSTSRELFAHGTPMGSRLPAPHLMRNPGGRYHRPIEGMVSGARSGTRSPRLLSPAVLRVGGAPPARDTQEKQHGKNCNGKGGEGA